MNLILWQLSEISTVLSLKMTSPRIVIHAQRKIILLENYPDLSSRRAFSSQSNTQHILLQILFFLLLFFCCHPKNIDYWKTCLPLFKNLQSPSRFFFNPFSDGIPCSFSGDTHRLGQNLLRFEFECKSCVYEEEGYGFCD